MRHEAQVAVLERLLAVSQRGENEPNLRPSSVEVERYTSPSLFEAERRTLLQSRPIVVGRAEDVAERGSFFTHDAAGVPVLVTRDHGDRVHVMLNVCRHRGTRLVDAPRGQAKAFVCPYHAWTYDLCGNLGHVPLSRCFPTLERSEGALVELPSEVRHGFVWAIPRPSRAPLSVASLLGPFDDDLAAFHLDEHVVFARSESVRSCNWKLVIEAFLEGYHVRSLHQHTLARFFGDGVVVDYHDACSRSVGARRNLVDLSSIPREAWDVRACGTVFYNLFPNGILVFHPDTVTHLAVYPQAIDRTLVVHTMLAPHAPSDEERVAWQKTWDFIDGKVFAAEDLAVCERIQSALHADAQRTFQLGVLEHPIRFFHDAIDRALAGPL